jgi:hypothetical protein
LITIGRRKSSREMGVQAENLVIHSVKEKWSEGRIHTDFLTFDNGYKTAYKERMKDQK